MSDANASSGNPFGPAAVIHGIVRYRGEIAQRALRLNRFLISISHRDRRDAYLADEEAAMQEWQLSESERELVRARDYSGLLAAGVNIYAIAKSGYVFGSTLLEIGASMRGETPQAFLEGRSRPTGNRGN